MIYERGSFKKFSRNHSILEKYKTVQIIQATLT